MAYQFYQETGLLGGVLNPSDKVVYVDSYNGDDADNGSANDPVITIQKAIDIVSTNMANVGTIVLSGYYNEGNFVAGNVNIQFVSEGYVIIDGNALSTFSLYNMQINEDYNFGRFQFINWVSTIGATGTSSPNQKIRNCDFLFCLSIGSASGRIDILESCLVYSSTVGGFGFVSSDGRLFINNTFVNSTLNVNCSNSSPEVYVYNNHFDTTSKLAFDSVVSDVSGIFDYNHIYGTLANKILFNNTYYDNIEDLKAAEGGAIEVNGIPSTTPPVFNLINLYDYTIDITSPLNKSGFGKKQIGCYNVAVSTGASDVTWTVTNVDNTTVSGEATLTSSPSGTLESGGIQVAPFVVSITNLLLPDFEQEPATGSVISSNLAIDKTPWCTDVEIQYSNDGGVTYNGTWLKCPIGMKPLHDTVNDVGNDSPNFVLSNSMPVQCDYIKYRVTLRDNEINI